tara:strand:+ start:112 stop:510 length:399 start_codon:yes stop_codon:yes gene_type:complete
MSKRKPEHSVHVRIDYPIDKRKAVLETAISSVELLKRYDRIKEIRKDKRKHMEEFREALSSIHYLLRLIRLKELPLGEKELKRVKTVSGKKAYSKNSMRAAVAIGKKKGVKKPKLSTLDAQLQALHDKLSHL